MSRPAGCKCPVGWWRYLDARPVCKKFDEARTPYIKGLPQCDDCGHVRACHEQKRGKRVE